MLSRRLFQRLTDSSLLASPYRPPASLCLSFQCCHCPPRSSRSLATSAQLASSSSTRWKSRQGNDLFAREARVQGLKSRAAFKLLELNQKHKLFKSGQTVVDLGYAPGSWSQVAVNCTDPDGRVIGIDLIPAQPPRGVSTIQGNFLSPEIQEEVRAYVRDPELGRPRRQTILNHDQGRTEAEMEEMGRGYVDIERHAHLDGAEAVPIERHAHLDGAEAVAIEQPVDEPKAAGATNAKMSLAERDIRQGRVVDVVLSDMSEPWDQTTGFYKKSLSDPYFRMMNTSGNGFRDHAGSMDLCMAALTFAFDTLKTGGHLLCKYYQGSEEKAFETKLKRLFVKVHREKPESSRNESKEAYFVGLRRKEAVTKEDVFRQ